MISNALKNWQQSRSYRVGDDAVYGVYQGVGFSAAEEDGGKLFIFMLSGPDQAFDNIEAQLASQRGDLRTVEVGDVETYLALFFDESGGDMPESTMDDLLDFVADNCRACGFKAPNVCIKCGAPANKRSFVDGMVQPMCAECRAAEKAAAAPRRPAAPAPAPREDDYPPRQPAPRSREEYAYDDNASGRSKYDVEPGTGNGALGAIVGALAGLTFYFVSAMLIEASLAAFCCLAGVGACLGYIAFNGRREKSTAMTWALSSSIILSLISVIAVQALNNLQGSFGATLSGVFSNLPWMNIILAVFGAVVGVAVCVDRILAHVGE